MCIRTNDKRAGHQSEFVGDFCDRGRLLQPLIGIDDKAVALDFIDDAPARKIFILVTINGLRNRLSYWRGSTLLFPSLPHFIVTARVREKIAIGFRLLK